MSIFNFISKEINVILPEKFFWSNSKNSCTFIPQTFTPCSAPFLMMHQIKHISEFFCDKNSSIRTWLYDNKDLVDGRYKRFFYQQWPQRKLLKSIERTVVLPEIFNTEYVKSNPSWKHWNKFLSSFDCTINKWFFSSHIECVYLSEMY